MNAFAEVVTREARLRILQQLASEVDGRLNEIMIGKVLDINGIRRDRDWVATQLRKLEALGAVEIVSAGTMLVAAITRDGRDHVEQRSVIEGVARPSEID